LFAAVLASALLAYLHGAFFAWLVGDINHHLRRRVCNQLLSVNFGFIEGDRSGRLLNVLTTDTWQTGEAVKILFKLVIATCTILVYVVLLLLISWRLTLVAGAALVLISIAVRLVTSGVRQFGERAIR